jgi:AcrR family transcriptional regulator
MQVSRQRISTDPAATPPKGAAARTRALMVATASAMLRQGQSPSVSDVAEAAGVSRSTAYRYFPTQGDMVRAVVGEGLGPVLDWSPDKGDAATRLASLFVTAFPRLMEHEATFRATLRQSLQDSAAGSDAGFGRGHRRDVLDRAIGGLAAELGPRRTRRLTQALSLTFGIEAIIVLKDIWGLDDRAAGEVALWAAQAMLQSARAEAIGEGG